MVPREELTDMGWEVYPQGLHDILARVTVDYAPRKIYVTESGCAFSDGPDDEGRITDTRRVHFLRDHLLAARRAMEDGVPLAGYFAWSLLDNFEWGHGFAKRFGIFWTDYETQQRLAKDSAYWYRRTISDGMAAAAHDVETRNIP